nr:hypothetical protein [Actinomycetota bacterium]
MSLKQRSVSNRSDRGGNIEESTDVGCVERSGSRRAGILLVVLGLLFVSLAAGDAVAGTGFGSFRDGAVRIHGGSGEDALIGGSGDDEIYGLSGRDLLVGGAGDDFIEASEGTRDQVRCGPGQDVVSVDE